MRTNDDADLEIPEFDFRRATRAGGPRFRGPVEIRIDGAVGYALRLIPSNKPLGRFKSTLEAWPAVVDALDSGRAARTLALDWHLKDGSVGQLAAGQILESIARSSHGSLTRRHPVGRAAQQQAR